MTAGATCTVRRGRGSVRGSGSTLTSTRTPTLTPERGSRRVLSEPARDVEPAGGAGGRRVEREATRLLVEGVARVDRRVDGPQGRDHSGGVAAAPRASQDLGTALSHPASETAQGQRALVAVKLSKNTAIPGGAGRPRRKRTAPIATAVKPTTMGDRCSTNGERTTQRTTRSSAQAKGRTAATGRRASTRPARWAGSARRNQILHRGPPVR